MNSTLNPHIILKNQPREAVTWGKTAVVSNIGSEVQFVLILYLRLERKKIDPDLPAKVPPTLELVVVIWARMMSRFPSFCYICAMLSVESLFINNILGYRSPVICLEGSEVSPLQFLHHFYVIIPRLQRSTV